MIQLPDCVYEKSFQIIQAYIDGEIDQEISLSPFEWKLFKRALATPDIISDAEWNRLHTIQKKMPLSDLTYAISHQLLLTEHKARGTLPNIYSELQAFLVDPSLFKLSSSSYFYFPTIEQYKEHIIPQWPTTLRLSMGKLALHHALHVKDNNNSIYISVLDTIMDHDPHVLDLTIRELLAYFTHRSIYTKPIIDIAHICERLEPALLHNKEWNKLYSAYTRPNLMDHWCNPTPQTATPFYDYLQHPHPREPLEAWMHYCYRFTQSRGRHPDLLASETITNPLERQKLYKRTYKAWRNYMHEYLADITREEKELLLLAIGYNQGTALSQKIKRTWYRDIGLLENGITLKERYEQLYEQWRVDDIQKTFYTIHDRKAEPHELFETLKTYLIHSTECELHL